MCWGVPATPATLPASNRVFTAVGGYLPHTVCHPWTDRPHTARSCVCCLHPYVPPSAPCPSAWMAQSTPQPPSVTQAAHTVHLILLHRPPTASSCTTCLPVHRFIACPSLPCNDSPRSPYLPRVPRPLRRPPTASSCTTCLRASPSSTTGASAPATRRPPSPATPPPSWPRTPWRSWWDAWHRAYGTWHVCMQRTECTCASAHAACANDMAKDALAVMVGRLARGALSCLWHVARVPAPCGKCCLHTLLAQPRTRLLSRTMLWPLESAGYHSVCSVCVSLTSPGPPGLAAGPPGWLLHGRHGVHEAGGAPPRPRAVSHRAGRHGGRVAGARTPQPAAIATLYNGGHMQARACTLAGATLQAAVATTTESCTCLHLGRT